MIDIQQYDQLFQKKTARLSELLSPVYQGELDTFKSPIEGFRMRAEFRFWHEGDDAFYIMFEKGSKKDFYRVDEFPIAHPNINRLMRSLRSAVMRNPILKTKLFQVEFLTTLSDDNLITLIYHRQLDDEWEQAAQSLASELEVNLIGRSRKQKIVIGNDFVNESLTVEGKQYHYQQVEGSFTQPNAFINQSMLSWALKQCEASEDDLLELYCGNGNFTCVLAPAFRQVLATEISKTSVSSAKLNFISNHINNAKVARLSSEEFTQALNGERAFQRLKREGVELNAYNFSTVLVDPPRAGLDDGTLELIRRFPNIIYISCNPDTLLRDLSKLCSTHTVSSAAMFDQFPYTDHIESGVVLNKKTI